MSTQSAKQDVQESQPTSRLSLWDVCVGIVPAIAVLPMMLGQAVLLWLAPETKLGIFVWLFVLVVVILSARGGVTRHLVRMNSAMLCFALGSVCFIWGMLQWSLNWCHFSACLFLIAWALGRCSMRHWHEVVSWGCLLALTIPISTVYRDLDYWLTSQSAEYASSTLDSLGVPHFLDELQITLKSGRFVTSKVTSAKLGLYAVVCCSVVWCWLWGRSLFASVMMVLAAAVGLLMTRYLAILLVSYGFLQHQSDWAVSGSNHFLISAGSFALCMLLAILFDRLIVALSQPIPSSNPEFITVFATVNAVLSWPRQLTNESEDFEETEEFLAFKKRLEQWRLSWYAIDWNTKWIYKSVVYGCTAVCGLSLIPVWVAAVRSGFVEPTNPVPLLELDNMRQVINAELLPAESGGFRQTSFTIHDRNPVTSEQLKIGSLFVRWTYSWEGYLANVELHAPVQAWSIPLQATDSKTAKTNVVFKDASKTNGWAWFDCRQTNRLGGDSYLMQCCLADDLSPASFSSDHEVSSELPLFSKLAGNMKPSLPLYNIQVICESGSPLSMKQLTDLQAFFETIRKQFQSKLPANRIQQSLVPQG